MSQDFLQTTFGKTGLEVHRLGLSATYRPGKDVIYRAIDEGINYFFGFGIDTHMRKTLREVFKNNREKYILAAGVSKFFFSDPNLRKKLETRLRQFGTDYIDIFLFMGVQKENHLPESKMEELHRLKEEGKVRFVGISTHNRKFAGKLATEGALDVLMMRYNAAHRGAEEEIFPHLKEHNPGIVSFTATRWRSMLKKPKNWHENLQIPNPGMSYRFVLSNPHVHVCMTAPSNIKHFETNLQEIKKGPLSEEEMDLMRKFGDEIYRSKKRFR
ncbi:aldo/keto reductase [candidate division KSB1 bacterium]